MPIKKTDGMGRGGQCPLRNLVARALPIGQWALNGHLSNTTLSIFLQFKTNVSAIRTTWACNLRVSVVQNQNHLAFYNILFFMFNFFYKSTYLYGQI